MKAAGFTLIETMIVVAIIGILMAISYPSYHDYVVKTRRVEGMSALIDIMQQQERYYSQNNTYIAFSSGSTDAQEKRFKWWSGQAAATSAYELKAEACPGRSLGSCVALSAMPGTSLLDSGFRDRECATLMLTSDGTQSSSTQAARCWP